MPTYFIKIQKLFFVAPITLNPNCFIIGFRILKNNKQYGKCTEEYFAHVQLKLF